jgi:predicted amidophosphoribosyltransferase
MALMKCPGCGAEVDTEQDFCMECGEPIAGMKPKSEPASAPVAVPASVAAPAAGGGQAPARQKPAAKRRFEEPEPVRCPGCGTKTLQKRCPGCGTPLKHGDDE